MLLVWRIVVFVWCYSVWLVVVCFFGWLVCCWFVLVIGDCLYWVYCGVRIVLWELWMIWILWDWWMDVGFVFIGCCWIVWLVRILMDGIVWVWIVWVVWMWLWWFSGLCVCLVCSGWLGWGCCGLFCVFFDVLCFVVGSGFFFVSDFVWIDLCVVEEFG